MSQCGTLTTGLLPDTMTFHHQQMRLLTALALLIAIAAPAQTARADAISTALTEAIAAFKAARDRFPPALFGVEVAAYGDALTIGRFASGHWGGALSVDLHESRDANGSCARYAAFVRLPPQDGVVRLTLCPQFSDEGTAGLRRLTVLHEMVHVVAGPDECRAMAFAAHVEEAATGAFTPVDRYWQTNACEGSGFSLP